MLYLAITLSTLFSEYRELPYISFAIIIFIFNFSANGWARLLLIDMLPLFALIAWLYGVILGLISGNEISYVFSNFLGIVFYIFYFVLLGSRQAGLDAIQTVKLSAFLLLAILAVQCIADNATFKLAIFEEEGLSAIRLFWTSFASLFAFLVGLGFYGLAYSKTRDLQGGQVISTSSFSNISFITIGVVATVLTGSKGFILGLIVFAMVLFAYAVLAKLRNVRFVVATLIYFVAPTVILAVVFSDELAYVLDTLISIETSPEAHRQVQAIELTNDFTPFGRGLGAGLNTGYSRDDSGYGFELTYHNVLHKFGFFSVPLLLIMFAPVFISMKNLLYQNHVLESIVALSLMTYLLPGYGNPILFAPVNVILNCYALYILRPKAYYNSRGSNV